MRNRFGRGLELERTWWAQRWHRKPWSGGSLCDRPGVCAQKNGKMSGIEWNPGKPQSCDLGGWKEDGFN